jgi:hypothetical protein
MCCLDERLLASQEELFFMKFFSCNYLYSIVNADWCSHGVMRCVKWNMGQASLVRVVY